MNAQTIAQINPLGDRSTTVYNAVRAVAQIDPLDDRTTSVFDAAGQTIATVNPLGDRATSRSTISSRKFQPTIRRENKSINNAR